MLEKKLKLCSKATPRSTQDPSLIRKKKHSFEKTSPSPLHFHFVMVCRCITHHHTFLLHQTWGDMTLWCISSLLCSKLVFLEICFCVSVGIAMLRPTITSSCVRNWNRWAHFAWFTKRTSWYYLQTRGYLSSSALVSHEMQIEPPSDPWYLDGWDLGLKLNHAALYWFWRVFGTQDLTQWFWDKGFGTSMIRRLYLRRFFGRSRQPLTRIDFN